MASCGADTDSEPLGLLPVKRLKTTDWKKCLICQVEKKEPLRKASATGIITLLATSKQRREEVFLNTSFLLCHLHAAQFF